MTGPKFSIFRVEWSEPYRPEGRPPYMVNKTAHVCCDTSERAMELVRGGSPEAVIHALHRLGTNSMVIVDGWTEESDPLLGQSGDSPT